MDAIQIIKKYWGWAGIKPVQIVERNQFGNLIVEDGSGRFWRICPEEFSCEIIARNSKELKILWEDAEFKKFWDMSAFAAVANGNLGEVDGEQCYYFIKAGDYSLENMGVTTISDFIIDSGIAAEEMEKQKP
jgi:hypothetical protein